MDDSTGNIVGISDDRNFAKQKQYFKFLDEYKDKVHRLLENSTNNFQSKYIGDMRYIRYNDTIEDEIDILCIPCKRIPEDGQPIWQKREYDKEGNKIPLEDVLIERIQNRNEEIRDPNKLLKFYRERFPNWLESGI